MADINALDNAAQAFEVDMGGGAKPAKTAQVETTDISSIFGNRSFEQDVQPNEEEAREADAVDGIKTERRKPQPKQEQEDEGDEGLEDDNEGDEPEEDEQDEDESSEDEDEQGEDEEESEELKQLMSMEFEVHPDGETERVSLREALDGYMRTRSFHKAMNSVDQVRQQVQREASEVTGARSRYIEMLDTLAANIDAMVPQEPDWSKVPADQYKATREQWDRFKAQRATIDTARAKEIEAQEAEYNKQLSEYRKAETAKTLSLVPEWSKDQKRFQNDFQSMIRTARSIGFKDEEIKEVVDSRMIHILLKASRYDKIMAAKKKIVVAKPQRNGGKPTNTGAAPRRAAPKDSGGARTFLSKTSSVESAVPVFQQILNRKSRS